MRVRCGSMSRKSCFRVSCAISPSAPAEFSAGGSAADQHERHPRSKFRGIGFALGGFKRGEDARAHRSSIIDSLEARRELFPLGMAEVLMRGSGSDDQSVVRQLTIAENHLAILGINAHRFGENHASIFLVVDDLAQRRGDIGRRERSGGNLIQKRLEEVIVGAVDERDVHIGALEAFRDGEAPAETSSRE